MKVPFLPLPPCADVPLFHWSQKFKLVIHRSCRLYSNKSRLFLKCYDIHVSCSTFIPQVNALYVTAPVHPLGIYRIQEGLFLNSLPPPLHLWVTSHLTFAGNQNSNWCTFLLALSWFLVWFFLTWWNNQISI